MRYRLALLLAALPGLAAAQRQRPAARGAASITIAGRPPGMWRGGQDVLLVEGQRLAGAAAGPAVVITGSADAGGTLDSAGVAGKIVFLAYGPGLNAIAAKVLPLRPLAIVLVAGFPDSIWAKLPGHEAGVSVRNPSAERGPAVPAALALRRASAGALFTHVCVDAD